MTDQTSPLPIHRLPLWARTHVANLERRVSALTRRLDDQPPTEGAWLVTQTLWPTDLPDRVLAGRETRTVRVLLDGGWIELVVEAGREGEYLSVRTERAVVVQPQSGNVVKIKNAEWM